MGPSPKELSDGHCAIQELSTFDDDGEAGGGSAPTTSALETDSSLRKRLVDQVSLQQDTRQVAPPKARLEVLYAGHYYDVTEFIQRHPGGNIIELYAGSGEDATLPIQQFHYRSFHKVLARMKGLRRRPVTNEESKQITMSTHKSAQCTTFLSFTREA